MARAKSSDRRCEAMTQPSKIQFGYRRHPDQDRDAADAAQHPVVVVGAGPVGLSLAIDLAQRGQPVCCSTMPTGSAKGRARSASPNARSNSGTGLASASRMVDKGVVWSVGKIFHGDAQLYQFNLLPEQGHKRPAFINLQQFYAEAYLVDRAQQLAAIELRWRNKVTGLQQRNDHVVLAIETPEGPYRVRAELCRGLRRCAVVAAADGGRGIRRAGVRGSVPDRRRQDDGGVSDRALVLVRSAVSRRALGLAAQAARRYLADRSAAQSGCGSGGREAPGKCAAADRAHARARSVRFRMDIDLQVPVPPDGKVSSTAG